MEVQGSPIHFDHLAFRTFAVEGQGIDSVGHIFEDFGYTKQAQALRFPTKKLRAVWYKPPTYEDNLPRVFISELKVDELSPAAQAIVRRHTAQGGPLEGRYAATCAATGILPWEHPSHNDYLALAKESEYAAWVLVNGYNLNHATIAVHRLTGSVLRGIHAVNAEVRRRGYALNEEGGLLKVSPDGGLLQSSTLADMVAFTFAGGAGHPVPGAYLEFAERLVLPQFAHLPPEEIREEHRRDGFEVSNADGIFESTRLNRDPPLRPQAMLMSSIDTDMRGA
jgi:hypothetical protein